MSLIAEMNKIANELDLMGYTAILPKEDNRDNIPEECADRKRINEYKREVSMKYFSKIAEEDTSAVLIVNEPKKGISNYIGANTFAEIAIAFYFNKKIFLLNDIYDPFEDELSGWGAVSLNGNINGIRQYFSDCPQ